MVKSADQRRKDRARPFSRKHARYWMTAAGGMVIIMAINLALGFWIRDDRSDMPPPQYLPIPPMVISVDAGIGDAPDPDAGGAR